MKSILYVCLLVCLVGLSIGQNWDSSSWDSSWDSSSWDPSWDSSSWESSSAGESSWTPSNIFSFFSTSTPISQTLNFAQFNLGNQQVIVNQSIPGTDNTVIYGIISYEASLDSLLVFYSNLSTETDNIGYYSISKNEFNPNPLYSQNRGNVLGYYLALSAINYSPDTATVYIPILDFQDSNVTIWSIDFQNQVESRIQYPEQVYRQPLYAPTGVYNQRVQYLYTYYVDATTQVPTILVSETAVWAQNYSAWEFPDWNIPPQSQVYLLHTEKYAEGRLFALVFENSQTILYSLGVFGGEATPIKTWSVVPGSNSITNGLQYITTGTDTIVVITSPSAGQYQYTSVNLWTRESNVLATTTVNFQGNISFNLFAQ